jgi:hypothetical protein
MADDMRETGPHTFVVEHAKTGRAACPRCRSLIPLHDLRIGVNAYVRAAGQTSTLRGGWATALRDARPPRSPAPRACRRSSGGGGGL